MVLAVFLSSSSTPSVAFLNCLSILIIVEALSSENKFLEPLCPCVVLCVSLLIHKWNWSVTGWKGTWWNKNSACSLMPLSWCIAFSLEFTPEKLQRCFLLYCKQWIYFLQKKKIGIYSSSWTFANMQVWYYMHTKTLSKSLLLKKCSTVILHPFIWRQAFNGFC